MTVIFLSCVPSSGEGHLHPKGWGAKRGNTAGRGRGVLGGYQLHSLAMGSHVSSSHLFAAGVLMKPSITLHNPAGFNSNNASAFLMDFYIPFCLLLPTPTSHALPFSVQPQ